MWELAGFPEGVGLDRFFGGHRLGLVAEGSEMLWWCEDHRRSFDCGVCDAFAQDDNSVGERGQATADSFGKLFDYGVFAQDDMVMGKGECGLECQRPAVGFQQSAVSRKVWGFGVASSGMLLS